MKTLTSILASILLVHTAHAQITQQQVDAFKTDFLSALAERDSDAFKSLLAQGASNDQVSIRYVQGWLETRNTLRGSKIDQIRFLSMDELEKLQDDPGNEVPYREMVDKALLIGREGVCYNVPIVGMVEVCSSDANGTSKMDFPVGIRDEKLCMPGVRPATQPEREEAARKLEKLKYVNPGLLSLKQLIDRANMRGKPASLVIVNREDREHLLINKREVPKANLKAFFLDIDKSMAGKTSIIVVDCGDESKAIFDLLEPIVGSNMADATIFCYSDADSLKHSSEDRPRDFKPQVQQAGAGQPATAPESKSAGKENPNPESKPAPR